MMRHAISSDTCFSRRAAGALAVFALVAAAALQAAGAVQEGLKPQDFNNLGLQAYQQGLFEDAIAYFEKAYEQAPHSEVIRKNLCNANQAAANELAKNQDFSAAAKLLEVAIGVDPENPSPLIQLGSYYLRLKMIPDAIFRLEEAVELAPGNVDAHELLGQAYYEDNDLASARSQWDFVLETAPERDYLRKQYEKAFREESVEYDFNRAETRRFVMSYPRGISQEQKNQILTSLDRAYWEIGRKFGGVYPPGQVQVIAYSAEQFAEATQLEAHVGALFDGKIRVPLTDHQGETLLGDELKRRLVHEYVHVVVRYIAGDNVPWWLNEGLAETFSKTLTEEQRGVLQRAFAEDIDFPLSELQSSQLTMLSPEVLGLAYTQAHATTQLLWTRYGQPRLAAYLSDLAVGMDPQESFRRHYRRTYKGIEAEVASAYQ